MPATEIYSRIIASTACWQDHKNIWRIFAMGFPELMIILVIFMPFALIYYFVFYRPKKRRNNFLMNRENISSAEVDNKSASVQTSIEDKLRQLDALKEKNLINDEEYNKKKEKLLEEI